jgi:hypothetical protein
VVAGGENIPWRRKKRAEEKNIKIHIESFILISSSRKEANCEAPYVVTWCV